MMPNGEDLGARLRQRGSRWGPLIVSADELDSSNRLASRLARAGAPHGSLVLAGAQTRGRGRWNRRWDSRPGGLYLSVVLRPDEPWLSRPSSLGLMPLLCAVATAEAITGATGIDVQLRWPNDLYVAREKIAGILCESSFTGTRLDSAVAGIGVNVNQAPEAFPPEVASRAGSIRTILRREVSLFELACDIVVSLERWWDRDDGSARSPVLARFEELAFGLEGLRVRVAPREGEDYLAETRGLADDGGLRVELDDGTMRTLRSDDVHLLEE